MLVCGEREAMVTAPPAVCDSAVLPCYGGCPASLPNHFPPQSPLSHRLHPSLCSQQQPSPWECSTIPKFQLPEAAPSRGRAPLFGVRKTVARNAWFSFHLDCHRSAATLSLKCFSSDSDNCPDVGIRPLLQFLHPRGQSSPTNTPVYPPSSFVLPSFMRFYILFSTGQVLLSALSCLHALLCLKVYSWCIHGERCTPCSPTPSPSCSLSVMYIYFNNGFICLFNCLFSFTFIHWFPPYLNEIILHGTIRNPSAFCFIFSEVKDAGAFPSPGDRPHPGIEPTSLTSPALAARFFSTSTTWEALRCSTFIQFPNFQFFSNFILWTYFFIFWQHIAKSFKIS